MIITSSIFIFLLGVGAFVLQNAQNSNRFNGSNQFFRDIVVIVTGVCFLIYFASLILLFVKSRWFVPLIIFGASSILAPLFNLFLSRSTTTLILSFFVSFILSIVVVVFDIILL